MRVNSLGFARPAARTPSAVPAAAVIAGASAPVLGAGAWCAVALSSCVLTLASVVGGGMYLAFLT